MDDNEDEPEDVRRATPVEEEILRGEIDESSGKPTRSYDTTRRPHRCEKESVKKKPKEKSEGECCQAKAAKASKAPKTATVYVFEKKCTLPKIKAIPRHCLTKEEWIDILAAPSRKCPSPCLRKPVTRKIRPVSTRMAELAQPPKQRLLNTLESRGGILPVELVDNLIQTLEGETCLTPEQAEKMFRDKDMRSRKKCRKKNPKCKGEKMEEHQSRQSTKSSTLDKDAVNCQYMMAESFVRSILDWKCPIPREEFKDIADVILKRLAFILEYNPLNGADRKSQQMRFLADVIGSWIAGVLFEVAEVRKKELEEECERRKRSKDEESEDESDEETDEDYGPKDDDDDDDKDDDDDDGGHDEKKDDDEKPEDGGKDEDDDDGGDDQTKDDDEKPDDGGKDDGEDKPEEPDDDKERESSIEVIPEESLAKDISKDTDDKVEEKDVEDEEKKTPMTEPEVKKPEETRDEPGSDIPQDESVLGGRKNDEGLKKDEEDSKKIEEIGIVNEEEIMAQMRKEALETERLLVQSKKDVTKDDDIMKKHVDAEEKSVKHPEKSKMDHSEDVGKAKIDVDAETGSPDKLPKIDGEEIAKMAPIAAKPEEMAAKRKIDEEILNPDKLAKIDGDEIAKMAPIAPEAEKMAAKRKTDEEILNPDKLAKIDGEEIAKMTSIAPEAEKMAAKKKTDEEIGKTTDGVPEVEKMATFPEDTQKAPAKKTEIDEKESPKEVVREAKKMDDASRPSKMPEMPQTRPEVTGDAKILTDIENTSKKIAESFKSISPKSSAIPLSKRESLYRQKLSQEFGAKLGPFLPSKEGKEPDKFPESERGKLMKPTSGSTISSNKYRTDTPFVTFDRIFHTIYNAIENSDENKGNDPIANRIHRAVYEKFASVVQEEKPGRLTEVTRDVLDVMSGKIALWLRNVLTNSQLNFVNKYPATVDSSEIREWSQWISQVSETADDWSKWIRNTIKQAEDMRTGIVTRGDWHDWTENVDIDAVRWRRFYLESMHQGHQNLTMIRDRQVVKTGTRNLNFNEDEEHEKEVKITDLEVKRRRID